MPSARTHHALTAILTLTLTLTATAQPNTPPECAYYLHAAQDMHHSNTTRYADILEDLHHFTETWPDRPSCDDFHISSTPPHDLTQPGDNTIALKKDGYTTYLWNNTGAWHLTQTSITTHDPTPTTATHTDDQPPPTPTTNPDPDTRDAPSPQPKPTTNNDPLQAAHDLLDHGAYHQAEEAFTTLITHDVNNLDAHRGLARARYHQGKYHAAATSLELALALDPHDSRLHIDLGTLRTLALDPRAGITAINDGLRLNDDAEPTLTSAELATAHAHLAISYQLLGQHTTAATHYETAATHSNDDNRDTWQHAAIRARSLAGDDPSIIIAALQATQERPASEMHLIAAHVYHNLGDLQARDQQIALALEHANSDSERARALHTQATYSPHLRTELYQQASELDPNLWQAAYNAGITLLQQQQPFAALPYLHRAHELAPDEPLISAHLARAHLHLHQPHDALAHATRALDDTTTSSDTYHQARITAAHAAHALGDSTRVILHLATAPGELEPASLTILGLAYYDTRAYPKAAETLNRAHQQHPDDTLARNLAQAYLADDNGDAALPILQELIIRSPDDAALHEQLGWAYRAIGDTTRADLAFRRANSLR